MHAQVPIKRILVGIDFSDAARQAFYAAIGLASRVDAETYVLHVAEPIRAFDFGKKRYVETAETIERVEAGVKRRLDELWKEGGAEAVDRRKVHVIVRGGKAAPEILATAKAKNVDLIVLGSSEHGGFGSALGSVPDKVMHDAHCSVLCVRARGEKE
ncbi:MAG: universal stress protein [Deltaproteobacteria bacterium]|nr:universal stress protein [Deltaproteobacteria bacterium]